MTARLHPISYLYRHDADDLRRAGIDAEAVVGRLRSGSMKAYKAGRQAWYPGWDLERGPGA
ncbi:MAG: hypothetical protein QW498_08810 [Thermofilum sp.]